jgi:hypothetical protein
MNREQIYDMIDGERFRQDEKWSDRSQYQRFAPHILILEEKLSRFRDAWYDSKSEELHYLMLQMATIAVRALEEVPGTVKFPIDGRIANNL